MRNSKNQKGLDSDRSLALLEPGNPGVDPSDHPIRQALSLQVSQSLSSESWVVQELERIQLYFKKVRTAAEGVRVLIFSRILAVLLDCWCNLWKLVAKAAEKELAKERLRVDVDVA